MPGLSSEADVIQYEGKWLKRIPYEEAFRIRCDVQLYGRYKNSPSAEIYKDVYNPAGYIGKKSEITSAANLMHSWWWVNHPWFVEVDDPDKEEYVSDEKTC